MWIKNTDGIHSCNLMDSKPPEYLPPKLLPNINQYISVITIASEIINQKNVLHPQSHSIRNNPHIATQVMDRNNIKRIPIFNKVIQSTQFLCNKPKALTQPKIHLHQPQQHNYTRVEGQDIRLGFKKKKKKNLVQGYQFLAFILRYES